MEQEKETTDNCTIPTSIKEVVAACTNIRNTVNSGMKDLANYLNTFAAAIHKDQPSERERNLGVKILITLSDTKIETTMEKMEVSSNGDLTIFLSNGYGATVHYADIADVRWVNKNSYPQRTPNPVVMTYWEMVFVENSVSAQYLLQAINQPPRDNNTEMFKTKAE